jgi:hypothetical protein
MNLYNSVTQKTEEDNPTQSRKSLIFTGSKENNEDNGVSMIAIWIRTDTISA